MIAVLGKCVRLVVRLGILAAIGFAIYKLLESQRVEPERAVAPPPPPKPKWVAPEDDGSCPASHPIKAKESSHIFHRPGGANYNRTNADRCYATEEGAAADGFKPAKR